MPFLPQFQSDSACNNNRKEKCKINIEFVKPSKEFKFIYNKMKKQISIFLFLFAVILIPLDSVFATDKLLQQSDFIYKGAFRVPQGAKNNSMRSNALSFGGKGISFRSPSSGAPNGSIYIVNRDNLVSELVIPAIKNPRNPAECPTGLISCLNTATWKHGPMDILNGNINTTWEGHQSRKVFGSSQEADTSIWGTLVYNNKLISTVLTSYDADTHGPFYTHSVSSLDWDNAIAESVNFSGIYQINAYTSNAVKNSGFVGGYMATVPSAWQTILGGTALTGMIRESTVSNGSFGPSLVSFDPDALSGANTNAIPGNILVGYPSSGVFYNYPSGVDVVAPQSRASMNLWVRGAVFPEGSKSVVVFGATGLGLTGLGDSCYGENTADVTQVKSKSEITSWWSENGNPASYSCGGVNININSGNGQPDNPCCFDSAFSSKGQHSYPYIARAWFYSADDMAAVKAGTKNYDEVLPYAQWDLDSYSITPYRTWDDDTNMWSAETNSNFSYTRNNGASDLPFAAANDGIMGAAYDDTTQTVYLVQKNSDMPGLEPFPLIHAFQLNLPIYSDVNAPAAPNGLNVI